MIRFFTSLSILLIIRLIAQGQDQPTPKDLISTQKGSLPIILSAPHGGKEAIPDCPERAGKGVEKFVVVRDTNTLELAEKLAARIEKEFKAKPFLVLARFDRKYADVNRSAEMGYESEKAKPFYEAYHAALTDACKEVQTDWGRGILLDLHGQAFTMDTIYRGTRDFKSVKLLQERFGKTAITGEKSLLGQLEKKDYRIRPANDSDARENMFFSGGYIVDTYGSHQGFGIDAIQLEFGANFRMKNKLDQVAEDLTQSLKVFAKEYLPTEKKKKK